MKLKNNIYKSNNIKRELSHRLNEKYNCDEKENNIKVINFEQNHTLRKSIKNNYIINKTKTLNDTLKNRNNIKRNLIKKLKISKYFTQYIKEMNLLLITFFFFIKSFIPILPIEFYEKRKCTFLNEITIKIRGTDIKNILYENYQFKPDEVYIEGNSYSIDDQNRIMDLINDENNITMKWSNGLTDCTRMFYGLSNLIEVDLSNFDFSQEIDMSLMFRDCYNLEYIKFNNNIENKIIVSGMSYMFINCISLKNLDLSNFDTTLVTSLMYTFSDCISLVSLNLNGFNTSSVTIFMGTFNNCSSLISLDLSSFNTYNAVYMNSMFSFCSSLTSIDLSNFRTLNVYTMAGMFYDCSKLKYLDLSNFDTSGTEVMTNLFYNCSELVFLDISNFNTTITTYISEVFTNCNNLKYINISNYMGNNNLSDNNFFEDVPENITYCFNEKNEIPAQFKNRKCSINDCSNNWEIMQKKIINGTDICVYDCSLYDEYKLEFKKTCYNDCPEGTYLSTENNKCIIICGEDLPYEINEECVSTCNTQDFLNNICKINNQNINSKEYMINSILNDIADGSLDLLLSKVLNEDKNNYFINNNNTEIFHITSLFNQKNNDYNNVSKIDIGECENILKKIYEINSNETLILFKIDFYIENYSIPITEYEIFHPRTKEKLDLNYCNQTKMKIYSPAIEIDEESLYKYNPNSEYYKDKCYPSTSSDCRNEDILEKRKAEFNNNHLSLCESNCIYNEYNSDTNMALCECPFKSKFMNLSEILRKIDKLLYYEFQLETDNLHTNSYSDNSFITNNIKTDSNTIPNNSDQLKECLFRSIHTKDCEELIEFEDLINKNYIPVNSKDSINKVFELFQEELKNKTINKNKNEIIEGEDVTFHMTTTEKKATNDKISHIDFFECEKLLQEKLGIEEPLIIVSVDIKRNDTISTQVEYQVFNPYTLEPLNLSLCENVKIDIYTPVSLDSETYNLAKQLKDQGYDIFNSSDAFYNDICSTFNSENNTDIILRDRRKDFYNPNITLCEENCKYDGFDIDSLKVKCQCGIKPIVNSDISKTKFTPNTILENFYKLEKYANIKIVTCYNLVFNSSRLKNNFGNYFIIVISLLFIITMIIIFATIHKKTNDILRNIIIGSLSLNKKAKRKKKFHRKKRKNVISPKKFKKTKFKKKSKKSKNKNENNILNSNENQNNNLINNPSKKRKRKNNFNKKKQIKIFNKKSISKSNENSKQASYTKNAANTINEKAIMEFSPLKNEKKFKNSNDNGIFIFSNKINNYGNFLIINNNNKHIENEKMKFPDKIIYLFSIDKRYKYFIDDELNSLGYEYALKIDTRSYCQVYYSLLKQNHLIIFTFCVKNDYNIFLLKFALFLITFALFLFMNALFFEDDSLHKIYEDQGKYNFLYQIPQILYSTIFTQIISSLLEKLSLSQDEILSIKESNLKEFNKEIKKVIKYIIIKCILFFIVSIILLFGFWYYLSAFCAVYYNTQTPLIKDNFISFLTSMLYPFLLDLIPVIFRIISLRKKMKCLYIFSKILIKIIGIL